MQEIELPEPPKIPTRSKLWHEAHTREGYLEFIQELKFYEKQYMKYLKFLKLLLKL